VWGIGAVVATIAILCTIAARAETAGPNNPSFLLFAGTDFWRDGAFGNGGLLWSPTGLNQGGFTLKLLLAGGQYIYPSSTLHMDVAGTLVSASALPGWRMTNSGLTIGLYAGPIVQDYRLTPYDLQPIAGILRWRPNRRGRLVSPRSGDHDRLRRLHRLDRPHRIGARRHWQAIVRAFLCRS
jgi:hypothetical protein